MIRYVSALFLFLASPLAMAQDTPDTPDNIVSSHNDVWLAGQPNEADIQEWASSGVTTVINLRPDSEMEGIPFDEPETVSANGMNYISIPMPRAAYTLGTIALITEALDAADGRVVVHCTIGWRASHAYTAYLIESGALAPENAADLNLWPCDGLNQDMMHSISASYSDAFPE